MVRCGEYAVLVGRTCPARRPSEAGRAVEGGVEEEFSGCGCSELGRSGCFGVDEGVVGLGYSRGWGLRVRDLRSAL